MLKVRDYMTTNVVTAKMDDGLHTAYRRMRRHSIRHMPVVQHDGTIVGIVSERDLRRPDFVDPAPDRSRPFVLDNRIAVEHAMTPIPRTVFAEDALTYALDLLVRHRFGALPVVDGANTVIGILSSVDVLDSLRHHLQ